MISEILASRIYFLYIQTETKCHFSNGRWGYDMKNECYVLPIIDLKNSS